MIAKERWEGGKEAEKGDSGVVVYRFEVMYFSR